MGFWNAHSLFASLPFAWLRACCTFASSQSLFAVEMGSGSSHPRVRRIHAFLHFLESKQWTLYEMTVIESQTVDVFSSDGVLTKFRLYQNEYDDKCESVLSKWILESFLLLCVTASYTVDSCRETTYGCNGK